MDCSEALELAEFHDQRVLVPSRSPELQRHLDRCPECRAELETRRALGNRLRGAIERDSTLDARPEFLRRLSSDLRARARAPRGWAGWRWTSAAVLAAAAACAIVALGAGDWVAARRFEALARQAVADHENCAVRFRLGERPVGMAEAGRRFGPMYAALSALTPRPRTTRGQVAVLSRHACVYEGRRFAHIEVRYEGVIGSVLVTSSPGLDARQLSLFQKDGLSVVSFVSSDHAVFVVCPLGESEARELAEAFEPPITRALAGF